jgi:hypothetical protein
MGLLDAIDKLLEPITKRLNKVIRYRPLTDEESEKESLEMIHDASYSHRCCNVFYSDNDD